MQMMSVMEIPVDIWKHIVSFIDVKSRFTGEVYTVNKSFHAAVIALGVSVSVDIVFHPVTSYSVKQPTLHEDLQYTKNTLFHSISHRLAPPPNPFRYPSLPSSTGDGGISNGSEPWKSYDVHCTIVIKGEDLACYQIQERGCDETKFKSTLRKYLSGYFGDVDISDCVVRCPETFPYCKQADMCTHSGRLPKRGVYALKSAQPLCQPEQRSYVTHADLIAISSKSLESMLVSLPGLQSLAVTLDISSEENMPSFVFTDYESTSRYDLEVLSVGYYNKNISAHDSDKFMSVNFFISLMQWLPSLKHVSIETVPVLARIAPLFRTALAQNIQTISLPLQDINEYLRLLSTQKDIFKAMSCVQNVIICGYADDTMTVQYISHLIRFFANIPSLRNLIFDMGGDYDDDNEADTMARVIDASTFITRDIMRISKLCVFLDFE